MIKTSAIPALIESAEHLLETGAHETALRKLKPIWDLDKPNLPANIEGCSDEEAATVLLYCGIHYGFYGITKKGAQEISKNLLTDAYDLFNKLPLHGLPEIQKRDIIARKVLCANYLALSYRRMRDIANADSYIRAASSLHNFLPAENTARLHTFIVESLVLHTEEKHTEIIDNLQSHSKDFLNSGNTYLLAQFYDNLGTAQKNTGKVNCALRNHILANNAYRKIKHHKYFSYSENNIACLYRAKGELDKAFEYAERSLETAQENLDFRHEGCVEDTLSLLYCDKEDYKEALLHSQKSIALLKDLECYGYLIGNYKTLIYVLWKLGRIEEAYEQFFDAHLVASKHCGEAVCKKLRVFMASLSQADAVKKDSPKEINPVDGKRDLAFPEDYKPQGKLSTVDIVNDDYLGFGLKNGWFAVIEEMQTITGDRVAIERVNDKDVEHYLGFIDSDFGLISLEVESGDLEVFNEDEVKIIGKVIGYCTGETNKKGNIVFLYY